MWLNESIIYQIYPLGLLGAPRFNHGVLLNRISKIKDWIEHIKRVGFNCVLFNPLMESDAHGYDTRDYFKVDCRLGEEKDLKEVCDLLHENGIKILFDGVFNHVGRGFWAFRDVQEKKWNSEYKDWFKISFDGNSPYNDGFWYEGWEGHFELVKLNVHNPAVQQHLYSAIKHWIDVFNIDGLRLDVAYSLEGWFLSDLKRKTKEMKPDFVLIGETLHGDYNRWMNENACHSVTNYECYKGIYSSFNSANMHEIGYSLNRQFGYEPWCIYRGKTLLSFLDNHDVTRIATILNDKNTLKAAYGLVFGMPGVPSVYYGSEWGIEGEKKDGDNALRPNVEKPQLNELTEYISALIKIRKESNAIKYGGYRNLFIRPKQLVFEREHYGERVVVAINADSVEARCDFSVGADSATDMITGERVSLNGLLIAPYSCKFYRI